MIGQDKKKNIYALLHHFFSISHMFVFFFFKMDDVVGMNFIFFFSFV